MKVHFKEIDTFRKTLSGKKLTLRKHYCICTRTGVHFKENWSLSGNYYFQENTIRMKVHFKEIDTFRKTLSGTLRSKVLPNAHTTRSS
jgi:hypothetical protein